MVLIPALSVALGSVKLTVMLVVCGVAMLKVVGQVTEGGSWSNTTILKEHEALLPAASLALHTTDVEPTGKRRAPEFGGVQIKLVTLTLSVAEAE